MNKVVYAVVPLWLGVVLSTLGQCLEPLDLSLPPIKSKIHNSFQPVVKNQELNNKEPDFIRVYPANGIVYDAFYYQRQVNWSRPYWLHYQSARWNVVGF